MALLGRLAGLAAPAVERELIYHHACQIHVQALQLAAGLGRRAYKIKAGNGGYSAKPIKPLGRSAELQRLERSAKSGSLKRWLAARAGSTMAGANFSFAACHVTCVLNAQFISPGFHFPAGFRHGAARDRSTSCYYCSTSCLMKLIPS